MNAQSIISGWVSDKSDKKPIDGVVITLLNSDDEIAAYGITKHDGSFTIQIQSNAPTFMLHARLLGYKNHTQRIENKSQLLYIQLDFGEIELREVVVKSKPMWNREDTIVYSVGAFKSLGDKTIGDLLKKLPGIEVSETGGIKYQGESINKFYIEGLDLLEKRYGIATNNVPVDAVQNVEVIENHQPLKTLKELVPSSNAAINLRLKNDKMARPVGTVTVGTGYADNWLWLAEAFALSAAKKQQFIVMYKGNNAAKDIASELSTQTLSIDNLQDESGYSQKTLLNPQTSSYPPLEKKRYLFNNSHIVSANNLWKTNANSQLRLNFHYLNNVLKEDIFRNSEYLMPDGTLKIEEHNTLSHRTNSVDAAITFTNNSPGFYLNNALTWSGNWNKVSSLVEMNRLGVHQRFNLPSQVIKNELRYVKRSGERVWDFTSFAVYSSQPEWLSVRVDTLESTQFQHAKLSGFYTRNSTYYSVGFGNSSLIVKGAAEASIDNYRTDLTHPVFKDSISSNLTSDYFVLELIPTYMYRNDKLTFNADVSLKNHHLTVADKKHHFLFTNPSLSVNYRFSPMLSVNAGYKLTHTMGDFMDITNSYLMSAYRNFNIRSGILARNKRQSLRIGLRYRNPLTTFFCNTSLVYAPSRRNTVATQYFVGTESVNSVRELSTHSRMWLWMGYVGKYFATIRTNTSLNISYNLLKSERQQQGILYPISASGWSLMPKINMKLSDASSISYQTIATKRITHIAQKETVSQSSMWQITQQLFAYYLLGKNWQFSGRLEHAYNEIGKQNTVKMFFCDFGISYKQTQMELTLSVNNLLNEKSYAYSIYNGLDRFDYEYQLHPRMIILGMSWKF